MKKPHWFKLIDLATLGGLGVFATLVSIYVTVRMEVPKSLNALALCWAVTLVFFGIYARYCWLRKKWLDEFKWYPTYGVMFHPEEYELPTESELDNLVKTTVDAWAQHFPSAGDIVHKDVIWCWMKKGLDESTRNIANQKVNGLTIPYSRTMLVDYDSSDEPLAKTAFSHELGHVIMGLATADWDQETHHKFAKENQLP